jgi:DegV family protein with EDD domain
MSPSRTALIYHPDPPLRGALAGGLTQLGYEAVPLADANDLQRFSLALSPALLAIPSELLASPLLATVDVDPISQALVVLGIGAAEPSPPWDQAIVLDVGQPPADVLRRLDVALLGRRIGLPTDLPQEALVGGIAQVPFLEVVQRLALEGFTGRLQLGPQEVLFFAAGQPTAAWAHPVHGVKAFCRLAQRQEGELKVIPCTPPDERNLTLALDALMHTAVMDNLGAPFDARSVLSLHLGAGFFEQEFSPLEKELLTHAQKSALLQAALDATAAPDGEVTRAAQRLVARGFLRLLPPAPRIRVVTDSTADLPAELARKEGIAIVPLTVRFGDKVLRDRVDLQPKQFYELLAKGDHHPQSSPPTPAFFDDTFRELLRQSDVLSIHISSRLSQTHANALEAAKDQAHDHALEVVDSRHTSLALGLLALFANRMAARGMEVSLIANQLRAIAPRLRMLFAVDTLDYLVKGGRLGRARGFFGSMLGIKPILGMVEGEIVSVDKVRGSAAVQPRLLELVARGLDPKAKLFGCIFHANAPVAADALRTLAAKKLDFEEILLGEMGPVVGTHAGPGALGIAVFQPTANELPFLAPLP